MKSFFVQILCISVVTISFFIAENAYAATLHVNPNTGVYTVGNPFTIHVLINTDGKMVNAADGALSFNPRELQVLSASRGSSIFNLWTEEPVFSNSGGTVTFGGGSPTGYKGTSGNVITVTFKALGAGTPKVTFKSGSVLAADGLGTNVLTGMSGGTFTIAAASQAPEPEYIAPANTPSAPKVTSVSHPDPSQWYTEKNVELSWILPADVTAVRTLLDSNSGTVPTIVYDERITKKSIEDLDEGVSYFHIQFKNKDGWGKITHYRLAVDSQVPSPFTITVESIKTEAGTEQVVLFEIEDDSPVTKYKIQIDGNEPFDYEDKKETKRYALKALPPGHHTIIIEAFDSAGNSVSATHSFTVEAFEKPVFTDYPERINTEVIPAIKGTTRPNATVAIEVRRAGDGSVVETAQGSDSNDQYAIKSDANGNFVYVPNSAFDPGVYVITAIARDASGQFSERSDEVKIIVEKPGYIVFGSLMLNVLSVLVPLVALVILLIFGTWYLWHRLVRWKKKVLKETLEAEESLTVEFTAIVRNLNAKVAELKESRKGKLTKAETELISQIEADLTLAREKIGKEIEDIEDIIK